MFYLRFQPHHTPKNLRGVWRGYFVQKAFNEFTGKFMEDKYKYEIQINQLPSSAIEGVTYSYKNIVFYGKASFKGIYTKGTDNVLVKELKMLELKNLRQMPLLTLQKKAMNTN